MKNNNARRDNDGDIRRIMNQKLNEEQSISQTVKDCTEYIKNQIMFQCSGSPNKISPITKLPYYQGEFQLDVSQFLPKMRYLTIVYYIYSVKDLSDYDRAIKKYELEAHDSEADYENKRLIIVSCLQNGHLTLDFNENLYHEITHLYQYDQGMKKRINLYDNIVSLIRTKNTNQQIIGWCGYLTFKHEQDAFVHQYYSKLVNSKFKGTFQQSVRGSYYEFLTKIYQDYEQMSIPIQKPILNKIGYDVNTFHKKVHFGIKRFKRKMFNAFRRYEFENQSMLSEALMTVELEKYNLPIEMEGYFNYGK